MMANHSYQHSVVSRYCVYHQLLGFARQLSCVEVRAATPLNCLVSLLALHAPCPIHAPFMVYSWCLVAELCRSTYIFVKISLFFSGCCPHARPISLRSISFRATPSAATAAFVNPYIPSFLASPSLVPSISLACPLLCKRACSRSKMKIHFTFYSLNRSLINNLPEICPSGSKTV